MYSQKPNWTFRINTLVNKVLVEMMINEKDDSKTLFVVNKYVNNISTANCEKWNENLRCKTTKLIAKKLLNLHIQAVCRHLKNQIRTCSLY